MVSVGVSGVGRYGRGLVGVWWCPVGVAGDLGGDWGLSGGSERGLGRV